MSSFSDILSLLTVIYSDIIEPIFCLLYSFILIRIVLAKSSKFHTAFYKFSVATGIAAITNVLINVATRLVDVRFQILKNRGFLMNMLSMGSHICALAMSIGVTLSVSTRFTAICMMNRKNFWEGRIVPICLLAMFGIPCSIYWIFLVFPAVFSETPNGYGFYLGIAFPGQLIAKGFATCGYFFFFFTSIPMCALSVMQLRRQRINTRLSTDRHEKMLAFYAVILTGSHMFKSILQTVWFIALVLNMTALQANSQSVPSSKHVECICRTGSVAGDFTPSQK